MSKPKQFNGTESRVIAKLDEMALYEELAPAIRAVLKYGGSVDSVLRKSQGLAAARLIELLNSEKDDIKLKAAVTLLERVSGKAIERKVNIYGDLAELNPKEIDQRIKRLLGKGHEAGEVIDAVIEAKVVKTPDGSK